MSCKQLWIFAVAVALSLPGGRLSAADESKTPAKTSPWKPEDVVYAETINDFSLSPDTRSLVWIRGEGDKEKDERVSNLFLTSLVADRTVQLTRGNNSVSLPQWSPDGEWIAFLSSHPRQGAKPDTAGTQIWLISAHGGEAYPLTELERAPRRVQWLDKDTLIFSAAEDPSAYEQAQKKRKDDSEVVDDAEHEPPGAAFQDYGKRQEDHAADHEHRLDRTVERLERWQVRGCRTRAESALYLRSESATGDFPAQSIGRYREADLHRGPGLSRSVSLGAG